MPLVECLVKGAQRGSRQRDGGYLPLHLAASRGHAETVKAALKRATEAESQVLLKAGSNVHEQTDAGYTALDLAT